MSRLPSRLEQQLDLLSKVLATTSKVGILVGGICVISYSLRVGHFPADMSIGDGLLFLVVFASFGVFYTVFTASLISLGILLSPLTRRVVRIFAGVINRLRKSPLIFDELAPFEWSVVLPALLALLFIFVLAKKDPVLGWILPIQAVVLYFFYSLHISSGKKITAISRMEKSTLQTVEKENIKKLGDLDNLKSVQMASLFVLLFMPLVVGNASEHLLDAAMRAVGMRVENPTLYIKEPYSALMPKIKVNGTAKPNILKDYIAFENAKVLFRGFGKNTVIDLAPEKRISYRGYYSR